MENSILKVLLGFTIIIFLIVFTAACNKAPQSTTTKPNDIKVEFLFEQDSVKVYRFYDGRYHYFTTRGETMSTKTAGKTHYEENIR